jgi:hypothetical protein
MAFTTTIATPKAVVPRQAQVACKSSRLVKSRFNMSHRNVIVRAGDGSSGTCRENLCRSFDLPCGLSKIRGKAPMNSDMDSSYYNITI